jgi:nucleoside-diphosphate-sugar epimerase
MLVTVTGGTGFLGSHSVAALLRGGHRVRLLVRREAAVEPALRPLGVDPGAVDVVVGDVTDEASVQRAVRGADRVLHAASVFSFDARDREKMRTVNARGTEIVLGAARKADVGGVVYVSSVVALMPSREPLSADSPVGRPREAYFASKAAAEHVARRFQAEGDPVAITYPPALFGPDDPHVGDQTERLRSILRGLMPMWPLGGFPVGDVRDTAALHARLLGDDGPEKQGRHFGPGRYLSTRRLIGTVREVTGRRLPTLFLPARAMLPVGAMTSVVQRFWPYHIPAEYGGIYISMCNARVAEDASVPLGIRPRPAAETLADTVRWLHGKGLLTDKQAGLATAAK